MPAYVFTQDRLYSYYPDGRFTVIPVTYNRIDIDEAAFAAQFAVSLGMPDIAAYKTTYQYDLTGMSQSGVNYRLYRMDDQIWLASLNGEKGLLWSIYKLKRTGDDYTYAGNHAVAFVTMPDGEARKLILSQPVRQNSGGIWCVERLIDQDGAAHLISPQSNLAAADYYAKLQSDCDGGEQQLLRPEQVAAQYKSDVLKLEPYPLSMSTYNDKDIREEQVKLLKRFFKNNDRLWYQDDFRETTPPGAPPPPGLTLNNTGDGGADFAALRDIFESCKWLPASGEPVIPPGRGLYLGRDSVNCFIFIPGTDRVTIMDDHVSTTYTAVLPGGGFLTDLMAHYYSMLMGS